MTESATRQRVRVAADIATLGVALVFLALVGARYLVPAPAPPPDEAVGTRLAGNLADGQKTTVLLVLASDCPFCQESMPFYRRLLSALPDQARAVVAAAETDPAIEGYLAAERIAPSALVFVEPGELPVRGTPTLLLVDPGGVVTHSWIGLLNDARQEEVLRAVGA